MKTASRTTIEAIHTVEVRPFPIQPSDGFGPIYHVVFKTKMRPWLHVGLSIVSLGTWGKNTGTETNFVGRGKTWKRQNGTLQEGGGDILPSVLELVAQATSLSENELEQITKDNLSTLNNAAQQ